MKYSHIYLILLLLCSLLSCNLSSTRNICLDENQNDYQESIAQFKKAVQENPNDENLLNDLGMSQYKLGVYEDAETTFTSLIELNREYEAAYLNRGLCRFLQQDHSGACEDFKSSIDIGYDAVAIENEKLSKFVQDNCGT